MIQAYYVLLVSIHNSAAGNGGWGTTKGFIFTLQMVQ